MAGGMTASQALLLSMASIPDRAKAAVDVQQVIDGAAGRLNSADPVVTILTLLDSGASAWWTPPPASLVFPRDHGLHLGCAPEWYWLFCNLEVAGSKGARKIGVVACLERYRAVAPAVQAQAGWSDEAAQLVTSHAAVILAGPQGRRIVTRRPNVVWPPLGGETVMTADPFVFACGPDSLTGPVDILPLRLSVDDRVDGGEDLILDLTLSTDMPARHAFFRQGDDGVTPPPRAGIYYSWPQLRVAGTVTAAGETHAVSGTGWIDHQMMGPTIPDFGPVTAPPPVWTPAPGIAGWSLCDLNFDNGEALVAVGFQAGPMLPQLPAPYGFHLRREGEKWKKTPVSGVIAMDRFLPLAANVMLPVAWNCAVASAPAAGVAIEVDAAPWYVDGSFLAYNQSIMAETPVDVVLSPAASSGSAGPPVSFLGRGYCESVGYEPPAAYMARALAYLAASGRG